MERFTSSRPALCIRHYLLGFVTLEGSDLYEILWYGVKYSRSLQNPRDTGPSPKLGDQHQPIRLAHLLLWACQPPSTSVYSPILKLPSVLSCFSHV